MIRMRSGFFSLLVALSSSWVALFSPALSRAATPPPVCEANPATVSVGLASFDPKQLSEWYRETLAFELREEIRNEDRASTYLLECGPLRLEIIPHPSILSSAQAHERLESVGFPYGPFKFGFTTRELKPLIDRLAAAGIAPMAGPMPATGRDGIGFILIRDLQGNVVQIYGALPNEAEVGAESDSTPSAGPVTPRLAAISVSDLDRSLTWYRDLLGFTETSRHDFSDEGLRIAFVADGQFELELIELGNSVAFAAPQQGNPASRRGFGKLAFAVDDLHDRQSRAQAKGAHFVNDIRPSNRLGNCHFIITDPDGNWIQLFGPCES